MLSPSQQKVYRYIQQFIEKKGFSPTLLEIAKGVGVKSKSLMSRYVYALEQAGYIIFHKKGHRRIGLPEIISSQKGVLPLLGKIAAGKPIEAVVVQEHLKLPQLLFGDNHYALRVKGDSMIDEGILDGDIVICKKQELAQEGQIVVALVDNLEATLKKIHYQKNGSILLIPANITLKPMEYDASRVRIQGIFVGLLRLPY